MTTEWAKASPKLAFRQAGPWLAGPVNRIVMGRPCAVSNHEGERAFILRDAAKGLLLSVSAKALIRG